MYDAQHWYKQCGIRFLKERKVRIYARTTHIKFRYIIKN